MGKTGLFNRTSRQYEAELAKTLPQGWETGYFENGDERHIRYGFAPATTTDTKGTIILTHGYGEHIDLYHEAISKYQSEGYDVFAMDFHGHGLSEHEYPDAPKKPSTRGLMRHVDDLDTFITDIVNKERDTEKPLIMSTHSMGGHIGLLYLKMYPGVFDGAVMSAPMFDIYRLGLGPAGKPLIRGIFNAASFLGLRDVHTPSWQSLGEKVGEKARSIFDPEKPLTKRQAWNEYITSLNPEAQLGRPTFGWIKEAFSTIDISMEEDFLKSIKVPVLIGSAGHETLVDNAAHRRAADLMPQAKQIDFPTSTHGLWFDKEINVNAWWNSVKNFIKDVPPPSENPHRKTTSGERIAKGEDIHISLKGGNTEEGRSYSPLSDPKQSLSFTISP